MLSRIRSLLRRPALAVPERTAWWRRSAPELCALAVYLIAPLLVHPRSALQLLGHEHAWEWFCLVYPGYALGMLKVTGPLMVLLAVWQFAPAVARESELGTLEALVLSPNHSRVLTARFLQRLWPLFRLAVCLAPIYCFTGRMSFHPFFRFGASGWSIWQLDLLWCFTPLELSDAAGKWGSYGDWELAARSVLLHEWSWQGIFFAGMRWINDVSAMLLTAGVAWWFSTRSRSSVKAAIRATFVSGLVLLTVLSPDFLWLALHCVPPRMDSGGRFLSIWPCHRTLFPITYWATVGCAAVARVGLAALLVVRSIRGFDRHVLKD